MDVAVNNWVSNASGYTVAALTNGSTTEAPMLIPLSHFNKILLMYSQYHGYISAVICFFGIVANILNIIVLTRKHMITPTNYILIALATSDIVTMSFYFVYAIYFYCYAKPVLDYGHSEAWVYFVLINIQLVITCHNMAMWLTVSLAVFRYIFVCHHVLANQYCSLERAKLTIAIVIVITVASCIPSYFLYQVVAISEPIEGYWVHRSDLAKNYKVFETVTFWIYGVIMKIGPCVLLTFLSGGIIYAMNKAKVRRQRLLQHTSRHNEETSAEHNRTTMMLVAVVLFFVFTEFPQGILAAISGLSDTFFRSVYANLGDLMDLLVLLNSAINFILYCIMSQQFRDTFISLFVCNRLKKIRNNNGHRHNGLSTYSSVRTEATQV